MSASATAWAWQQRAGKGKLLLLALADLADEKGEVRADLETLAEITEASRATAFRHIEELEALGLIERHSFKAKGGVQLVSITRLVMGGQVNKPAPEAGSQIETREPENADFNAVSNCDPAQPDPVKAESQNETHKRKDLYSLSSRNTTINNNYREALRAVDGAGLLPIWQRWVALGRLARPTQEAQIAQWAAWVGDGKAEALRLEAEYIITSGSYAHPFAALKKRVQSGAFATNAPTAPQGSAPPPDFSPGQRVRYPDGSEALILAVRARGVTTDHPDYPDVPLGRVRTLTVLP